jgi:hypothetical protein
MLPEKTIHKVQQMLLTGQLSCGGMVVLPCRLCEHRTKLNEKQALRRQARLYAQQIGVRLILIDSLRRERQRDANERLGPRKAG